MQTRARRVVLLVFDEVELFDVAAALEVLSRAGRGWNFRPFKVELCAPTAGLVQTRNQLRIEAPVALSDSQPADVLWIPGGYGARRLLEDARVVADVGRIGNDAEIIAGVGWGVGLLARAGLVATARVAAAAEVAKVVLAASPGATIESNLPYLATERIKTARASGAALELALSVVAGALGPKVTSMVMNELELPALFAPTRIELKY